MSALVLPRRRAPRMNPTLWWGAGITGLLLAIALLSLVWTPYGPSKIRISLKLQPPLAEGLLGTDHFGRDLLSMVMAGAWNSLSISFLAVLLGLAAGVLLGFLAAARRGLLEEVIMRFADVAFAFPAIILAVMIGALMGPGTWTVVLAIGIFTVPVFARVSRAAALQIWSRDFVLAARALGKKPLNITVRHVLPNIAGALAVQMTIQLGLAILTESGLSFLGLGPPPPATSWGRMLSDSQTYLQTAPYLAIVPGVAIALAVLGLNLLGDGLRDLLDPRMRSR